MQNLAGDFQVKAGFLTLADLGLHLGTTLTRPEDCAGQKILTERWISRHYTHDSGTVLLGMLHDVPCDCAVLGRLIVPVSKSVGIGAKVTPDLSYICFLLQSQLDAGGWLNHDFQELVKRGGTK